MSSILKFDSSPSNHPFAYFSKKIEHLNRLSAQISNKESSQTENLYNLTNIAPLRKKYNEITEKWAAEKLKEKNQRNPDSFDSILGGDYKNPELKNVGFSFNIILYF
jgi:hypothetical protein